MVQCFTNAIHVIQLLINFISLLIKFHNIQRWTFLRKLIKQDDRPPPEYLCHSTLLTVHFEGWKRYFFKKYFSKFNIFLIFAENVQFVERRQFTANLPLFTHFEKNFFLKTILYAFEKSCYLSRFLRQICHNLLIKKTQIQNRPDIRDIRTFSIAK